MTRHRWMQAAWFALAALVVSLAGAGSAHAQVIVVTERDLSFGLVTPGVPVVVAPTDVVRSAQLRMQGQGRYQLSFQLPTSLVSRRGEIPLEFGSGDAMLTIIGRGFRTFDPHQGFSFNLAQQTLEAEINLGGRAHPGPGQPAGVYTATIVVMIVQTGS